MTDIWYCYARTTGDYAGSGTPYIDNATHGSTLVPVPKYNESQIARWDGTVWRVELRPAPDVA